MKRRPVLELYNDYKRDVKFLKTFCRPENLNSVDMIIYFPLSPEEREIFKTEETRIFNMMIQQTGSGPHPSILMDSSFNENHKISKMNFKPHLKVLSADFFTLPNLKHVFRERLPKFFALMKAWTKGDYFNLDYEYLRDALEGTDLMTEITTHLNASFRMVKSVEMVNNIVAENLYMNLEVFFNNFKDKAKSKLLFLNRDANLGNKRVLLVVLLEFVLKKSFESRGRKRERETYARVVNKAMVQHMVNRLVKESKAMAGFFRGLNVRKFKGFESSFINEQEFFSIADLQKDMFGPTDFNHSYFGKTDRRFIVGLVVKILLVIMICQVVNIM